MSLTSLIKEFALDYASLLTLPRPEPGNGALRRTKTFGPLSCGDLRPFVTC